MPEPLKVCLVAAPLMARSGVYRSTLDLIGEANNRDLPWSAVIGMRPGASGAAVQTPNVEEVTIETHGRHVVSEIESMLRTSERVQGADVIITLITQSDLAAQRMRAEIPSKWVAYVRGLPWPDRGEQSWIRRRMIRTMESRALRSADDLWATTPLLADQIREARAARVIPAGIAAVTQARQDGTGEKPLVWAGRIDGDKNPQLFLDLVQRTGVAGNVYGEGPIRAALQESSPPGVSWRGWADPTSLWDDALAFVGTSHREAFGRSAVEAAQAGLPVVLSDQYGAAPLLVTDPELRSRLVLPLGAVEPWVAAVNDLASDPEFRLRASKHVQSNALGLTISASMDHVLRRLEEVVR